MRVYPLDVHRAVRQTFAGPARLARDPANAARLRRYLGDMLHPYGLPLDGDPSAGQSYGEMAEALIVRAVEPGDGVDLLVLAFAVPDISPGRATATYLSHVCPGNPLAFAICDQGNAAAYTGLRIIAGYARTGGYRRALLLIVEQADLPYSLRPPVGLPTAHTAVALLLGASSAAGRLLAVRTRAGLSPDVARATLAGDLTGVPDPTLILGGALAGGTYDAPTVRVATRGQPSTGVWWELVGEIDAPDRAAGHVVLADYDEQLGYLCTATFASPVP